MKRLYNRKILFIAISLLIITIGIKIHSAITFPQITDWNYRQLQKIDKKAKNFSFAVFGDNKNSITTFENLINAVNLDDVMFSIDIGDLSPHLSYSLNFSLSWFLLLYSLNSHFKILMHRAIQHFSHLSQKLIGRNRL